MKRMKHPRHGFHHAYNLTEEAVMRGNGWVDDVPDAPEIEAPVVEVLPPEVVRRPVGRPRKNIE